MKITHDIVHGIALKETRQRVSDITAYRIISHVRKIITVHINPFIEGSIADLIAWYRY